MLRDNASTYDRVLELLKRQGGGLSVKELCQKLDLSSMAVRRQLTLLEGEKLVLSEKEKQKTGRPLQRYYLTGQGHERFERHYDQLANQLLVALRAVDGKGRINQLFDIRRAAQVDKYRQRVQGKTLEARVHEVTQILSEDGYMASWEKLDENRYLIKEMNCAVAQVARRFPQTCISEQEFLADLLNAKVTRRHHILQKHQFCSYLVEG